MKISMSTPYPISVLPASKRKVSAFQTQAPLRQSTKSISPQSVRFGGLGQVLGFLGGQAARGVAMGVGYGFCAAKGAVFSLQGLPVDVVTGLPAAMPAIGAEEFINCAKAVKKFFN